MNGCLAELAAALVDGELDHAAREKAQRHLLHCDACRAEVDLQRRLKARLRRVDEPSPSDALTARLLALPVTAPLTATEDDAAEVDDGAPGAEPAARAVDPTVRRAPALPAAAGARPLTARRAARATVGPVRAEAVVGPPRGDAEPGPARAGDAARPPRRRRARVLGRRSAAGSAFALLGVTAALALGTPPQRAATTPVDPASDAFVTEFVGTTSDGVSGPLTSVSVARPGVGSTFVPLTRGALLSSGGDRGAR